MSDPVLKVGALREDKHDRVRRSGWIDPDLLAKKHALVVGAGAIGNELVKNLALSGVGRFTLVDMDRIEPSNLSRCVFFSSDDAKAKRFKAEAVADAMRRLAPEVRVVAKNVTIESLGEAPFLESDVILSAVDNVAARLHLNANAMFYGVPLIEGGMEALRGRVQVVAGPAQPCLECLTNKTHRKVVDVRFSCTGANMSFFGPKLAAEITTTSLISAVMAREALKALHGRKDALMNGLFVYDGVANVSEVLETVPRPGCLHHDTWGKGKP